MAVNINGETLVITLESGVTNLDWIDVYSDWKNWLLASPENRGYPEAFRTTGGDPLNAFLNAGAYWFLRNDLGWRIKPPEEHITILAAGNLAAENADIDMFLPTTGAYTTQILGLQPITQGFSAQLTDGLKYGFYNNRVTIDVVNGITGTGNTIDGEPIGTLKNPSNNLTDTITIALNNGFGVIYVVGNLTVDTGDYDDMVFIGESHEKSIITVLSAASVERCEFYSATIAGTLDGKALLNDCMIEDLVYVNGEIKECVLKPPGIITLGGSNYATFFRCVTECTAGGPPVTIDMGGTGHPLALRDLSGAFKLMNKTGPEDCSAVMAGGAIYLDLTTMLDGRFKVAGTCDVYDWATKLSLESGMYGNFELINKAVSRTGVAKEVWDEVLTAATHNIPTSAGRRLRDMASIVIHSDTAEGSGIGNNQIEFNGNASAVDGAYDPAVITIIGGTGTGQTRLVLQYNGTTKIATVDRNWKVNPDNTSQFVISAHPGREHVNEGLAQGGTINTITLNALASSDNDTYIGQAVFIRSGTGEDQACKIIAYNGTTKVATTCKQWAVIPDTTSGYVMLPTGYFNAETLSDLIADTVWNGITLEKP